MRKYWRVVANYGHVGRRNEVSVPRYIETPDWYNLIDVMDIVRGMPGVKKTHGCMSSIFKAEQINEKDFLRGKEEEDKNLYIKRLRSFKQTSHEFIA